MAIIVYIACVVIIYLLHMTKGKQVKYIDKLRYAYLETFISLFLLAWILTQFLSLFNLITSNAFIVSYIVITLLFVIFFKRRARDIKFEKVKISKEEFRILMGLIVFILIPLLFIAIYFPPNNNDSITCWIPRIEHWLQNQNIEFYPAHETLQNTHQPLSSYVLLQIRAISKSDYFLNMVQFFAFIGVAITNSLIIKKLNIDRKGQILAFVFTLTIPIGILESVTTQNDLMVSFFALNTILWFMEFDETKKEIHFAYSALSFSLGVLIKLTLLVFGIPFLIWFAMRLMKSYRVKAMRFFMIFIIIFSFITTPYFYRNYMNTNNIFGKEWTPKIDEGNNENVTFVEGFVSNSIKNFAVQLALPFNAYNKFIDSLVYKAHDFLGIDIESFKPYGHFYAGFYIHEDSGGNIVFIIITFFTLLLSFKFFKKIYTKKFNLHVFFLCVLSGYLLFSSQGWTPYSTRYFLVLFNFLVVFNSYIIYRFFKPKMIQYLIYLLIITSIPYVYLSENRSLLPIKQWYKNKVHHIPNRWTFEEDFQNLLAEANNEEKSFLLSIYSQDKVWMRKQEITTEDKYRAFKILAKYQYIDTMLFSKRERYFLHDYNYIKICNLIRETGYNKIGLLTDWGFREYQIWGILNNDHTIYEIRSICTPDYMNEFYNYKPKFDPDLIITYKNDDYLKMSNVDTIYHFGDDIKVVLLDKKDYNIQF